MFPAGNTFQQNLHFRLSPYLNIYLQKLFKNALEILDEHNSEANKISGAK